MAENPKRTVLLKVNYTVDQRTVDVLDQWVKENPFTDDGRSSSRSSAVRMIVRDYARSKGWTDE